MSNEEMESTPRVNGFLRAGVAYGKFLAVNPKASPAERSEYLSTVCALFDIPAEDVASVKNHGEHVAFDRQKLLMRPEHEAALQRIVAALGQRLEASK